MFFLFATCSLNHDFLFNLFFHPSYKIICFSFFFKQKKEKERKNNKKKHKKEI